MNNLKKNKNSVRIKIIYWFKINKYLKDQISLYSILEIYKSKDTELLFFTIVQLTHLYYIKKNLTFFFLIWKIIYEWFYK